MEKFNAPSARKKSPEGFTLETKERIAAQDPGYLELDKKQRSGLRSVLLAAGIAVLPMKGGEQTYSSDAVTESVTENTDAAIEQVATGGEAFAAEVAGYYALAQLGKNEVLFVDTAGRPVGDPQPFRDFIDTKPGVTGEYLYTPGTPDEAGILPDGIAGEWLNYAQQRVQVNYPDQPIAGRKHVVEDFKAAFRSDDPELVAGIAGGDIETYDEILSHYIDKPIPGHEDSNRVSYLQDTVVFRGEHEEVAGVPGAEKVAVPQIVQAEFKRVLPGVFAQESRYREDVVNGRSGAKGPGQFTPDTWQRYTGEDEVSTDFTRQVEVLGPCISDMYDRVFDKIGLNALDVLRQQFGSEEAFLVDLIVPLTVMGYNAGPDRAAEAARLYATQVDVTEMPLGKDVFLAIVDFAKASETGLLSGVGSEVREYTSQVYAQAALLNEMYNSEELTESSSSM